jgi:hypothetical protein
VFFNVSQGFRLGLNYFVIESHVIQSLHNNMVLCHTRKDIVTVLRTTNLVLLFFSLKISNLVPTKI